MSGSPSTAVLSIGAGGLVCLFAYIFGAGIAEAAAWGTGAGVVSAIACRITDG